MLLHASTYNLVLSSQDRAVGLLASSTLLRWVFNAFQRICKECQDCWTKDSRPRLAEGTARNIDEDPKLFLGFCLRTHTMDGRTFFAASKQAASRLPNRGALTTFRKRVMAAKYVNVQ